MESCQSWTEWLLYGDAPLAWMAFNYKSLGGNGSSLVLKVKYCRARNALKLISTENKESMSASSNNESA